MVGPLRDDLHLRRRKVGIGIHGHALKGEDSADRDESGQHQHEKSLTQRGLDDSVDHSMVDTILTFLFFSVRGYSALQRVCKLQEQAAISDYLVASFQSAGDLRLPVETLSERYSAPAKLIRRGLRINKGLVLAVAQHGCIGQRNGIWNRARIHIRKYEHILLQFLAGIISLDARL